MRRVLVSLLLALSGVVLTQLPAEACSCVAGQTLTVQTRRASDVLVGTVETVRRHQGSVSYDLQVERTFKGTATSVVRVRTPARGASCGLTLVADRRYLVIGTRQGRLVEVNSCGGSKPASTVLLARVTRLLGAGTTPVPPPTPPPAATYTTVDAGVPTRFARLAAPGAAVALVGLLGLLLLRRLGRPR